MGRLKVPVSLESAAGGSYQEGAALAEFVPTVSAAAVRPAEPRQQAGLMAEVERGLRSLQVLLRSARLYQRNHPQLLDNLETAYESLLSLARRQNGLEFRFEHGHVLMPKLTPAPLPDLRGELETLARDLQRAGIHSLRFAEKFNVGELDTFAELLHTGGSAVEENGKGPNSSGQWISRLAARHVEGIAVNLQSESYVDTVLASLIAALVAFGGRTPPEGAEESARRAPEVHELVAALQLIARLTLPLESARALSAEQAARGIHQVLETAGKETVNFLFRAIGEYSPRDSERPQYYLMRLTENLVLEFMNTEFAAGKLAPEAVHGHLERLSDAIVVAGGFSGPHASQHLSLLAIEWAKDSHREEFIERFWADLPSRERAAVLRGPEIWCMPAGVLRKTLQKMVEDGSDAARLEARNIYLNYVRCLTLPEAQARCAVVSGLGDMTAILEALWPHQLPEDFGRSALMTLEKERSPQIAAMVAAFLETLGRIAAQRGDYLGFERILISLESAPDDSEHDHMKALAQRLVAQDRWLLLVDAALANRPLEPVLPRLLQRDPERLLDRLTLLLADARGGEQLPAMCRLLRAIGVPALGLLETRLYEARRQRVLAAIRLLAAADCDRLLRALPRAMGSWEWSLQDLAVSELARPGNAALAGSAAFVFSTLLGSAHPLVVPMMIDHIGVAQETTAIPLLMEIAAGAHESLRDLFHRIKAIEALGRMRAGETAELLRNLAERRDGLAFAEPGGLRATAEEALAVIENRPSAARVRALYETIEQLNRPFPVPRRYTRIPLESPLAAQIEGAQANTGRLRTISLGGACLQSSRKLAVGDSIKLEVRSGLRKIHFTAVVRNSGPDGNGIEIVHMKEDDHEKLRRLVQKHLRD